AIRPEPDAMLVPSQTRQQTRPRNHHRQANGRHPARGAAPYGAAPLLSGAAPGVLPPRAGRQPGPASRRAAPTLRRPWSHELPRAPFQPSTPARSVDAAEASESAAPGRLDFCLELAGAGLVLA